jgi:hypothetical protein
MQNLGECWVGFLFPQRLKTLYNPFMFVLLSRTNLGRHIREPATSYAFYRHLHFFSSAAIANAASAASVKLLMAILRNFCAAARDLTQSASKANDRAETIRRSISANFILFLAQVTMSEYYTLEHMPQGISQ